GTVVGTLAYMSPEQVRGASVDFRSDQFSFGVTLLEMLTGKPVFRRPSAAETIAALLNEAPIPAAIQSLKLPVSLRWAIDRCVEKDPGLRYGATKDLYRDLWNLRHQSLELTPATAAIPRTAPRRMTVAILAGAIALAALAAWPA